MNDIQHLRDLIKAQANGQLSFNSLREIDYTAPVEIRVAVFKDELTGESFLEYVLTDSCYPSDLAKQVFLMESHEYFDFWLTGWLPYTEIEAKEKRKQQRN